MFKILENLLNQAFSVVSLLYYYHGFRCLNVNSVVLEQFVSIEPSDLELLYCLKKLWLTGQGLKMKTKIAIRKRSSYAMFLRVK